MTEKRLLNTKKNIPKIDGLVFKTLRQAKQSCKGQGDDELEVWRDFPKLSKNGMPSVNFLSAWLSGLPLPILGRFKGIRDFLVSL